VTEILSNVEQVSKKMVRECSENIGIKLEVTGGFKLATL
jgi:hypothetical protein